MYAQRALQAQGQWYNGFEKKALTVTYSGPEHLNVPQPIANPPKLQVRSLGSVTSTIALHKVSMWVRNAAAKYLFFLW